MAKRAMDNPLNATKNGAPPTRQTVSAALSRAIKTLSADSLRKELESLWHQFPTIIPTLEERLLVQGKDVVRYHADTESEDNTKSETASEEGRSESELDGDASDGANADRQSKSKNREQIATAAQAYVARMARCENCNKEFDVTENNRGDCIWHSGVKVVDNETDFWADHDPDCHGPYEFFVDDSDFAEGFMWICCENRGDNEGCKTTKHKTKANLVPAAPSPVLVPSQKRSADEEIRSTKAKKRRQ